MRYGIFSDIHSNLEALDEVLSQYENEGIDQYICVGDIVGYAANPKECIERVKSVKAVAIAGNHDWAAVGLTDTEFFRPVAKKAIIWTAGKINSQDEDFLKSLELVYENKDFLAVHGSLDNPEEFHYLLDTNLAKVNFSLLKKNICFVGHSHVAGVFIENKERINYSVEPNIKIEKDKKYIVNVGSVGQPRDRNNRAGFCIFDTEKMEVSIRRVKYDIEKAQEKIIRAGLPPFLATRLSQGM